MNEIDHAWRSIPLPDELDQFSIANILLICGQHLRLTLPTPCHRDRTILVYCSSDNDYAKAKSMIDQVVADAILRKKINERSETIIAELASSILIKASMKQ